MVFGFRNQLMYGHGAAAIRDGKMVPGTIPWALVSTVFVTRVTNAIVMPKSAIEIIVFSTTNMVRRFHTHLVGVELPSSDFFFCDPCSFWIKYSILSCMNQETSRTTSSVFSRSARFRKRRRRWVRSKNSVCFYCVT